MNLSISTIVVAAFFAVSPVLRAYTDYLRITSELAAKLATLVMDFVDYGETKAKFERLSRKLEESKR